MKISLVEENEGRLDEVQSKQRAEAMFYLGLVYEYGFGVEKNPKTAYSYFLQSSDM
jgi:TPR repeat protein